MKNFVFSADAHIQEPNSLFLEGLPPSLRGGALHATRDEKFIKVQMGDEVLHRIRTGGGDIQRQVSKGLAGRFADMDKDGIDAEILFPQLCIYAYRVKDPELELATVQLYNDWCLNHVKDHRDRLVPCAILPVRRLSDTLAELKRVAAMGYTACTLPSVTPEGVTQYNSEEWDPIFAFAAAAKIPFCLHAGTGLADFIFERGPGGAIFNYTRQITDAMNSITLLVGGGVLDRNPGAEVVTVECGASWLAGLSERMDEVFHAHYYVAPKLRNLPSEIVRRQVKCSFQFDRACVLSRKVTGHQAMMWGADYPHAEGTFPNSQSVIAGIFEGVDISESEKADIMGGTAARLFRLRRPEFANG
jgi:predicted TIM-barrel fold metal-dependent hydrolase